MRGNPSKSRYSTGARVLAIILSIMMLSSILALIVIVMRMG